MYMLSIYIGKQFPTQAPFAGHEKQTTVQQTFVVHKRVILFNHGNVTSELLSITMTS